MGAKDLLNSGQLCLSVKLFSVNSVSITDKVLGRLIHAAGLDQLQCNPASFG